MAKRPSGKTSSFLFFHRGLGVRHPDAYRGSHDLMINEKYYQPLLDIYETGESLKLEVELPGVSIKDIELYSIGNRLYLKADKHDFDPFCDRTASKRIDFLCMERKFGRFQREISLPVSCNTQAARAVFRNGVLVIEIPKIPDRRGRRLDIRIEEEEYNEGDN